MMILLLIVFFVCLLDSSFAFTTGRITRRWQSTVFAKNQKVYNIEIGLGEGYKPVSCQMRPIFQDSMFFTVEYDIPFSLNVDKPPKNFPCPIVNKDSPKESAEKEGDLLRATTCWSQGFEAAGVTSDIAMFAGNIRWRKSLFDATGAPWQETLNALLSNTSERSKTVTLVFEREIESPPNGDGELQTVE